MRNFTIILLCFLGCPCLWAQTVNIAYIGQAASYNTLITDSDNFTYDDDHAAAVWFMDNFLPAHAGEVNGNYLSFDQVAGTASLNDYDVVWIQMDGATYVDRMNEWPRGTTEGNGDKHCVLGTQGFQWNGQCTPTEDAFMAKIRDFYQAGGNVLLGNYAGKALEVIGAFDGLSNPWEYRPNQTFGDTSANPGNTSAAWGANWAAEANHPYLADIVSSDSDCPGATAYIEFLGTGTQKKNRACQYNMDFGRIFDDAGGSSSSLENRRALFATTLNAQILLQNCDGNEIQGAKFSPQQEGNGTIVWYGAGVYDWFVAGAGNNEPVKLLTENTLLSLAQSQLSTQTLEHDEITYYPNPVKNELHLLHTRNQKIEIFDLTGKRLISEDTPVINVEGLANGCYLVKATDMGNGKSSHFKIVKAN